MKRLLIPIITILLFSVVPCFAQPWGKGMRQGYGRAPHNDSSLNLTKEQADQLQRMRESYVRAVTHLQNRLFSKQGEIRLLWKANLDHDTAMSILALMKRIRKELDTTFVFSTHDSRIIGEAESIYRIEDGILRNGGNGGGRGHD